VSGALDRASIEAAFPNRGNNRGLFAATQFESARGGTVRFTLAGEVKGAWLNGRLVSAGREFAVEAKPGLNTLVLQVDDARLPPALRLAGGDVSFRTGD
jgi:hypothetical protein